MWSWDPQDVDTLDLFGGVTIVNGLPASGHQDQIAIDKSTYAIYIWDFGSWRQLAGGGAASSVLASVASSPLAQVSATNAHVNVAAAAAIVSAALAQQSTVSGLVGSPATWASTMAGLNPLSWWRLGETSGTTAADEEAVQAGTYVGSPTLNVAGLLVGDTDTAMEITATNSSQYMEVPHPSGGPYNIQSLSIVALVKTTQTGVRIICSRDNETSARILQFRLDNGALEAIIWNTAGNIFANFKTADNLCNDGNPHLVTLTVDSTSTLLYVDGTQQASSAGGAVRTNVAPVTRWGRSAGATNIPFVGVIDEPAIISGALTAQQVSDLWAATGL